MLVYYPGGAWVQGSVDSHDPICRRIAKRAGCIVVSADYRLAPEHPFLAPLADAAAAMERVAEYAESTGGDPDAIDIAARVVLTRGGIDLDGADFCEMSFGAMPSTLSEGRVGVGTFIQPFYILHA